MVQVTAGKLWLYQQDGASVYTSNLVQNWCVENLNMFWSKMFWPPSSSDLNPWILIRHSGGESSTNEIKTLSTPWRRSRALPTCLGRGSPMPVTGFCVVGKLWLNLEGVGSIGASGEGLDYNMIVSFLYHRTFLYQTPHLFACFFFRILAYTPVYLTSVFNTILYFSIV